jgi:hypothetical protein
MRLHAIGALMPDRTDAQLILVDAEGGFCLRELQTLPPREEPPSEDRLARASGFSLHAGVSVNGGERTKLEHLVRYVARPAVAVERLALTPAGRRFVAGVRVNS